MGAPGDLDLIRRLEQHAFGAWPATVVRRAPGGWRMRATPGLDRARSNHALPPFRELGAHELGSALHHVHAFAGEHGIRVRIQVSPQLLHGRLEQELDSRGWEAQWPTLVLTGPPSKNGGRGTHQLEIADHATPAWLETWARCESRRDPQAHADTVFALLRGKATFARLGDEAAGMSVVSDGFVGLFCLAVAPEQRRRGLGTALVRALVALAPGATPYLQVDERNAAARAMYERLGFTEAYRYRHRVAPAPRW